MTAYRAFFKYICGTLLGSDFYSVKIRAPSAGRANGAECNTPIDQKFNSSAISHP